MLGRGGMGLSWLVWVALLVGCSGPGGGSSGNDAGTDGSAAVCGNGRVEEDERCDTAILAGETGACPDSCEAGDTCVSVELVGSYCTAECVSTPITECISGDGCCPTGCDGLSDGDCVPLCGNGLVDPGETCDPPAACPTTCDSVDPCESGNLLGSAATCDARCEYEAITGCGEWAADGCCPSGCDASTDADCEPVCGNGVLELPEQCDDQNLVSGDGCDATCMSELPVSAFRAYDIDVLDPHMFVEINPLGCLDITNPTSESGGYSVNEQLEAWSNSDTDGDGFFDLSFVFVFRPLLQQNGATAVIDTFSGSCDASGLPTHCAMNSSSTSSRAIYTVRSSGSCLIPDPAVLTPMPGGYDPPVDSVVAPCFLANARNVVMDVNGFVLQFVYAEYAGSWTGDPDHPIEDVIIRAFVTEADADTTFFDSSLPFVGGIPVSRTLPGGQGNCAPFSDLDQGPDGLGGTTSGWWFHFLYRFNRVEYDE